jgi:hypothetical protein
MCRNVSLNVFVDGLRCLFTVGLGLIYASFKFVFDGWFMV